MSAASGIPASGFDLVIFDCDGVLVDSEPVTMGVLTQMLNELGATLSVDQAMHAFIGRSLVESESIIAGFIGREPPAGFHASFIARRDAALADRVRPVAHVPAMLGQLRHPFAVASGAETEKMKLTLGCTGLLPMFEQRLFSASMVARSKPAPDVYLLAARTLGVAPQRCLVVEDTPIGTAAGIAAGMTVLGYCERQQPASLLAAGASAVFNDMRHLPRLVGPPPRN